MSGPFLLIAACCNKAESNAQPPSVHRYALCPVGDTSGNKWLCAFPANPMFLHGSGDGCFIRWLMNRIYVYKLCALFADIATQIRLFLSSRAEPFWEANRHSFSQEIRRLLWSPNVHYRVGRSSPLVFILSHLHSAHTFTFYFFKSHFSIIFLPLTYP
jgi:hypothetical protein